MAHKIPRDFATWPPRSRLAALRHKEAYIGRLGQRGLTYELIGNLSWQNIGAKHMSLAWRFRSPSGGWSLSAVLHGVNRRQS